MLVKIATAAEAQTVQWRNQVLEASRLQLREALVGHGELVAEHLIASSALALLIQHLLGSVQVSLQRHLVEHCCIVA